jgi:hypothetical protein
VGGCGGEDSSSKKKTAVQMSRQTSWRDDKPSTALHISLLPSFVFTEIAARTASGKQMAKSAVWKSGAEE